MLASFALGALGGVVATIAVFVIAAIIYSDDEDDHGVSGDTW